MNVCTEIVCNWIIFSQLHFFIWSSLQRWNIIIVVNKWADENKFFFFFFSFFTDFWIGSLFRDDDFDTRLSNFRINRSRRGRWRRTTEKERERAHEIPSMAWWSRKDLLDDDSSMMENEYLMCFVLCCVEATQLNIMPWHSTATSKIDENLSKSILEREWGEGRKRRRRSFSWDYGKLMNYTFLLSRSCAALFFISATTSCGSTISIRWNKRTHTISSSRSPSNERRALASAPTIAFFSHRRYPKLYANKQ